MERDWAGKLATFIKRTISPDGRDTYETTRALSERMLEFAGVQRGERVLDLGCGWGASMHAFAPRFASALGVDLSEENIRRARAAFAGDTHVAFQQGRIEDLTLPAGSVDLVVSSLVLHQVVRGGWERLFSTVARMLRPGGEMVMADEIILFEPEAAPEKFNRVYRYLLAHTTPRDVYESQIKPHLREGYIYTWEDMKASTPPEYWFYSIGDLDAALEGASLQIADIQEISPFFGLLRITHR
ncbi:MAG: SAM-dependent methyltransferase [Bacteroidia bacterium]|nr:MAG: SAM-dependent methyltransferase [Bacteroidia bacterium]